MLDHGEVRKTLVVRGGSEMRELKKWFFINHHKIFNILRISTLIPVYTGRIPALVLHSIFILRAELCDRNKILVKRGERKR